MAGQFTSPDTILPDDGYNILGLSRYAYVEGNPTTRNDPSGHCSWCIGAVVGAVVGAGISYGSQVVGNLQRGQSLGSALTHVDVAEIGKAALVWGGHRRHRRGCRRSPGRRDRRGAVAAVATRVVSWGFDSGVGQVADNPLHGRQWHQGVLGAAGWGAVSGPGGGRYGGRYLGRYLGRAVSAGRGIFHRAIGHVGRAAVRIVRITNALKTRATAASAWLTSWRIPHCDP